MRLAWLQHAEHEDPVRILPWLAAQGHAASGTRLHAGEALPAPGDFDALLVMGGPMNIYEHAQHPWLVPEKRLIHEALYGGKRVLGVCLGAQLIADRLGGAVSRNAALEVGWHEVTLTPAGRRSALLADWPPQFDMMHWHGDTYALPPGAECLAGSRACAQQAFSWDGGRVLGLQFHPEVDAQCLRSWFAYETPPPGPFVQSPESILGRAGEFERSAQLLEQLLARFFS